MNKIFNEYVYKREYRGNIKGVILDWSGTTIDKYVMAPAVVFVEVFKKYNVPITMREARLPMGLRKDLHIKAIMEIPDVKNRWKDIYGNYPTDEDVNHMFEDFVPMQIECLPKYTELLPGVLSCAKWLKRNEIKIGTTTGFTKKMVDIILKNVADQGYIPDSSVAGDEVLYGARPKPFMIYKNLDNMDIHPIQSVVKVDDTVGGVGEALEAGCWAVGVARWSNYMDVDNLEDAEKLSDNEIEYKLKKSRDILQKSGAHYVIDDLYDLRYVIEDINKRLERGEKP